MCAALVNFKMKPTENSYNAKIVQVVILFRILALTKKNINFRAIVFNAERVKFRIQVHNFVMHVRLEDGRLLTKPVIHPVALIAMLVSIKIPPKGIARAKNAKQERINIYKPHRFVCHACRVFIKI